MMQYLWAKLMNKEKDVDLELWFIKQGESMKATGCKIKEMGKVTKSTQMETIMKEIINSVSPMEREFICGLIMNLMKENGTRD
jgi:hypothetical protein